MVSGAVQPLYGSLGIKGLKTMFLCNDKTVLNHTVSNDLVHCEYSGVPGVGGVCGGSNPSP